MEVCPQHSQNLPCQVCTRSQTPMSNPYRYQPPTTTVYPPPNGYPQNTYQVEFPTNAWYNQPPMQNYPPHPAINPQHQLYSHHVTASQYHNTANVSQQQQGIKYIQQYPPHVQSIPPITTAQVPVPNISLVSQQPQSQPPTSSMISHNSIRNIPPPIENVTPSVSVLPQQNSVRNLPTPTENVASMPTLAQQNSVRYLPTPIENGTSSVPVLPQQNSVRNLPNPTENVASMPTLAQQNSVRNLPTPTENGTPSVPALPQQNSVINLPNPIENGTSSVPVLPQQNSVRYLPTPTENVASMPTLPQQNSVRYIPTPIENGTSSVPVLPQQSSVRSMSTPSASHSFSPTGLPLRNSMRTISTPKDINGSNTQNQNMITLIISPPYRRFKYLFAIQDKNTLVQLDVKSTHKLNKAYRRVPYEKTVPVTINGRRHIFDLKDFKYWPETEPNSVKILNVYNAHDKWYYRDDIGCIKPYDIETLSQIVKVNTTNEKQMNTPIIHVKIGKHEYELNFETKTQKNVKSGKERFIYNEDDVDRMRTWTVNFDPIPTNKTFEIITLDNDSDEYKKVEGYFRMNMPSEEIHKGIINTALQGPKKRAINRIHKIQKIINPKLREQWEFLLDKIKRDNNNLDPSIRYTRLLWHGSGSLSPSVIYEDVHYGWKINYASQKNLWGPGLYFGEDANYCHKYVYRTPNGHRQIFLAEVIVGDDIISLEDDTIKEPPMKEDGKTRYDSVRGVRHETSWIWIVYASGRAYPTYLLEYED